MYTDKKEGNSVYYSEDIIEEVRMKNDIVDVISSYVRLQKKEILILDCVRFIMKIPVLFCQPGQADVLLLWMRGRRECVYILDGI